MHGQGYRHLVEVAEISARLQTRTGQIQKVFTDVEPHLPATTASDQYNQLSEAVSGLSQAATRALDLGVSCDPLEARNAFEAVQDALAQVTFAFSNLHCELERVKCLTPLVFFSLLQTEIDEFGFLAAAAVSAAGKLNAPGTEELGKQCNAVWMAMQVETDKQLKRAFDKFQERQPCPPALCYDNATAALRKIIAAGAADSLKFTREPLCWDEPQLCHHRQFVDRVTEEIRKLRCKDVSGPIVCVLTRLGSLSMRLYAILDRGRMDLAVAVRTTFEDWSETWKWFHQMDNDPSPRVVHQLRTLTGIYRWLESRIRSYDICNDPVPSPYCSTPASPGNNEGELMFEFADENGNPIANQWVTITDAAGNQSQALTDPAGVVRRFVAKGMYTVGAHDSAPITILVQ
jgi:hypothetical protein